MKVNSTTPMLPDGTTLSRKHSEKPGSGDHEERLGSVSSWGRRGTLASSFPEETDEVATLTPGQRRPSTASNAIGRMGIKIHPLPPIAKMKVKVDKVVSVEEEGVQDSSPSTGSKWSIK